MYHICTIYGGAPVITLLITQAPPLPVLPVGVDAGYLGGGDTGGLAGLVDKVTNLSGLEVVCERWRMSQHTCSWLFVRVRARVIVRFSVRIVGLGLGLGLGL